MARGTVLSTIRTLLKAELRDSQESNTTLDAEYAYKLANKQKDLAFAYDWPFLVRKWDVACAVGDRYKNIPTADFRGTTAAINFERPVYVERYFNAKWLPVDYGIEGMQLNYRNSDLAGQQPLDPIQRWQLVTNSDETSNPDQIEIWPVPATAQTLRFTGQRVVYALVADGDKADLDDLLLVYFVAADYLALRGQQNAPMMLKMANDRLIKLRASYPSNERLLVFGKETIYSRRQIRTTGLVVVAGN